MKKLLTLLCLGVFLISLASAWDFDNVKRDYNSITKEITVKNAYGLGDTLGKIKLVNYTGYCFVGECYAYYEVQNYLKDDGLRSSITYDKSKTIDLERSSTYEIWNPNKEVIGDVYSTTCKNKIGEVKTDCVSTKTGTKTTYGGWDSYDVNKGLPIGNYLLRQSVDVKEKETVDVIPEFYGITLEEFAPFTGLTRLEYADGSEGASYGIDNDEWRTQIFTIGTTGINAIQSITGLSMPLSRQDAGTTGTLLIQIKELDASGNPTGSDYSNATYNIASLNTAETWENITLTSYENLQPDTNYSLILGTLGISASDYVIIHFQTSNIYAGGFVKKSEDVGVTWNADTQTGWDWSFYLYGEYGKPQVTIVYPEDGSSYPSTTQDLNYTYTGLADRCWYSTNFGSTNSSTVSAGTNFTGLSASEGSNTWTVYCNNTGGIGNATTTFSVDSTTPIIEISSPNGTVDYHASGQNISLNWSITDDNLDSCWYEYDGTNYSIADDLCTLSNFTSFNVTDSTVRTLKFFANDTGGNVGSETSTWSYKIWENDRTLNSSVYQTEYTTYKVNVTSNISLTAVNLNYNGTLYSMSNQGGGLWSYSRDTPTSLNGTYNVGFNFTYGSEIISAYNSNQEVRELYFDICNPTNNIPYVNYTFKDEADLSYINASITTSEFEFYLGSGSVSKTLTYSNTSDNSDYAFCSNSNQTLYVDPYIQYKQGSSYPQRIYDASTQTFTTTAADKILYLLGSADGIYTTFQVVNLANQPLSDVEATAVREINEENVVIGTGTTDAAGSVVFWVNPDFSHTFTFTKTGYGTSVYNLIPTQSQYTITMGTNSSEYVYLSDFEGLKWYVFPGVGIRNESTATNYGFNISAVNSNLVKCRIDILNQNKSITLATAEADAISSGSLCSVYVSHTINSTYPSIKGRLLIDIGDGWMILEDDAYWHYEPIDTTGSTFTDFFNGLKVFDLRYFNDNENHREYTYILLFFLVVMIICAVMNYAGWDIQTAGGMIYLVGGLVWIASIPGFLNLSNISPFSLIDKYFVAIIYSMFMVGFALRRIQ